MRISDRISPIPTQYSAAWQEQELMRMQREMYSLRPPHKAWLTDDVTASTTATCVLDFSDLTAIVDNTTDTIDVTFNIHGGGFLEDAFPKLQEDDMIWVVDNTGTWRALTTLAVWPGTTPDVPHKAFLKADAGTDASAVCYLDTNHTGTEIDVSFTILGGGNLSAAFPKLLDNDCVWVVCKSGDWKCIDRLLAESRTIKGTTLDMTGGLLIADYTTYVDTTTIDINATGKICADFTWYVDNTTLGKDANGKLFADYTKYVDNTTISKDANGKLYVTFDLG